MPFNFTNSVSCCRLCCVRLARVEVVCKADARCVARFGRLPLPHSALDMPRSPGRSCKRSRARPSGRAPWRRRRPQPSSRPPASRPVAPVTSCSALHRSLPRCHAYDCSLAGRLTYKPTNPPAYVIVVRLPTAAVTKPANVSLRLITVCSDNFKAKNVVVINFAIKHRCDVCQSPWFVSHCNPPLEGVRAYDESIYTPCCGCY